MGAVCPPRRGNARASAWGVNIYIYSKIDWDEVQKSRRMVVLNPLVNLLIILKLTCLIKLVITQLHSQKSKTTPPCIFCTSANTQ